MVEPSERLSYKFQRLREEIRSAIACGDLGHKLPGERQLARRFGVNAKTISKALTDLCAEGVVVRQIGRGTFVAGQDHPDRVLGTGRQYLCLGSDAADATYHNRLYEQVRQTLEGQGHRLTMHRVEPDEHGQLPERCVPVNRLKEAAGVLLLGCPPSRGLLADLARRHLAVVLFDALSPSIKIDAVAGDYARGVFELTEHLIQLGHRRIQLLIDRHLYMDSQVQRGYHTALARYHLTPLAVRRCLPEDVGPMSLSHPHPSAIVCVGARIAATVFDYQAGGGSLLPGDLSVVAMTEPGHTLNASLTQYAVDPELLIDWTLRLMFEHAPGSLPRIIIVPGRLTDRGSAGIIEQPALPPDPHAVVL